jgi:two-component system, LuxR family, response regulator FixJ
MSRTNISRGEVYVVDDDSATREALSRALRDAGYEVIHFADSAALLTETRVRTPVCIFLDAHVEGRPLELLKRLRIEDCPAPILVASAQANIPLAVDAIKSGAFDFIKKPFCVSEIVARVDAAIGAQIHVESLEGIRQISQRLSGEVHLTKRERDVFAFIAMGKTNKEMARELGLSARTVEGYRATIMRKVGARSATDLVRRMLDQGRGD